MRTFSFLEASGEKDCLCCAALGEHTILNRKVTLLEGNKASVKFECPLCGYETLGLVSVDGSELGPSEPSRPGRATLLSLPDPLKVDDPSKMPKTDEEAMQMAFGETIDSDSLEAILTNGYPQSVEIGKRSARRTMMPYSKNVGERPVHGFVIEYDMDGEIVFSRLHMETEGTPDIDSELKALQESCLSAVRRPTMPVRPKAPPQSAPQGPVCVVSNGYNASPSVASGPSSNDQIRSGLLNAFRGGG